MKKRMTSLLALLLALCLCVGLTACGGGGIDEEDAEEFLPDDLIEFAAVWEYEDGSGYIVIYANYRYDLADPDGSTWFEGVYTVASDSLELLGEDGEPMLTVSFTDDGRLMTDGGDFLFSSTLPEEPGELPNDGPTGNWLAEHGLEDNFYIDAPITYLEDGGVYLDGSDYLLTPTWWSVVSESDTVTDGYREMRFTAICYFPAEDHEGLGFDYVPDCRCALFDQYTGLWLPATNDGSLTGDSDDTSYYVIDSGDSHYDIDITNSVSWEFDVDQDYAVMTRSYTVRFPAGYDGLLLCMQAEPADAGDYSSYEALCSDSPSLSTPDDIPGCDLSNALICPIR